MVKTTEEAANRISCSIKNGLHESLLIAKETGCDTVQIFRASTWLDGQAVTKVY